MEITFHSNEIPRFFCFFEVMNPFPLNITIVADNREMSSGVPTMLINKHIEVKMAQLSTGDYMINNEIIIERKTSEDFVQSIMNGRLFDQCIRLIKSKLHPLIIVEGNPFQTRSAIAPEAVRGAWLSVNLSWHIPIILSAGKENTVQLIITAAIQQLYSPEFIRRKGKKPKKRQNRQHYFIQSLPGVGPALAQRLLNHFGTIQKIITAESQALKQVDGIGSVKAKELYAFFRDTPH